MGIRRHDFCLKTLPRSWYSASVGTRVFLGLVLDGPMTMIQSSWWLQPIWKILLMEEILHQLVDCLSHYLQGFVHFRWCRISSINRIGQNGNLHQIQVKIKDIWNHHLAIKMTLPETNSELKPLKIGPNSPKRKERITWSKHWFSGVNSLFFFGWYKPGTWRTACPWKKLPGPKRKGSSSNHFCSGVILNFGWGTGAN